MRIFYFSGTGNAKRVAEWISNHSREKGVACEAYDIIKMNIRSIVPEEKEMIGLISPTHGFNYPPVFLHFIFRFPRAKNGNKIFLINTRAGMKISKFFLPGLSGIALLLTATVLLFKGYRIVGMRSIDLPSNWISLHPGLKEKVITSMFSHWKRVAERFIEKMIAGKRNYRALLDLPLDLAISPIAFGYYFIGRFILAKTFYASHDCDNCMLCINNCPIKAIRLVDNRPYWSYRCESCMRCMNNCPKRAIETAHGMLAVVMIALYLLVFTAFYIFFSKLTGIEILQDTILNKGVRFTFESIITLLMLILIYRLIHFLRRYKLFEWLMVYTSFTKFRFWRRYKTPRS